MILHLLREVVARLLVSEVEPVLVHQHLLVLEPLPPRFFRHVLEDALAELAGIRREIEPIGLAPELDALDHARHEGTPQDDRRRHDDQCLSMRARSACSNHLPCRVVKTSHQIPHANPSRHVERLGDGIDTRFTRYDAPLEAIYFPALNLPPSPPSKRLRV